MEFAAMLPLSLISEQAVGEQRAVCENNHQAFRSISNSLEKNQYIGLPVFLFMNPLTLFWGV